MGKRASAVARLEKRLSPPGRRTFRVSLLPTHDPIWNLTGAGCALPLRSAGCGGTSCETQAEASPTGGACSQGKREDLEIETYDRDY
jgi:hypothetical protein